ncbi:MAG: hypothetical protein ACREFK_13105 [Stellaceae bacterium]
MIVEDDKKIDLARLLIDIYEVGYIGHPRLETLLAKNSIKPRDFLTGPQEAEAFEKRSFVGLHQSTLRKVDVIANLADRAHSRQLKTNMTWPQCCSFSDLDCLGDVDRGQRAVGFAADREIAHLALDPAGMRRLRLKTTRTGTLLVLCWRSRSQG